MNIYQATANNKKHQIINLLKAGIAQRQIMMQCNISQGMLTKKLNEWNLKQLTKSKSDNNNADKVRKHIEENKNAILEKRKSGMGINRLAKEFNTSNTIITRYLALWQIPNTKHGLLLTVHDRYRPQPITDADFDREIKSRISPQDYSFGVSKCFPIDSNFNKQYKTKDQ
jgi:hypothetical protein